MRKFKYDKYDLILNTRKNAELLGKQGLAKCFTHQLTVTRSKIHLFGSTLAVTLDGF